MIVLERYGEEVLATAKSLRAMRKSWAEVAEHLTEKFSHEYDGENLRKYMWRYGDTKGNVLYEDKKPEPTLEDAQGLWDAIIGIQEASAKFKTYQDSCTLTIEDDKPVGVAFWSDWHLGGNGVDHRRFLEDRQLIRDTEGLYVVGMGDYKDNNLQTGHKGAVYEQVVPPGTQDILVLETAEYVKDKALAWVKGNHDHWSVKLEGKDSLMEEICKASAPAVNLWHGGVIYLTVGDMTYKIGARHTFMYNSSLNTTNSQRRLNEQLAGCDVVALGHTHQKDLHHKDHMGRNTVWLRSGTYKVMDDYAQQLGGFRGQWGIPIVILWPDHKEVLPVYDFHRGIEILKQYRGESASEA